MAFETEIQRAAGSLSCATAIVVVAGAAMSELAGLVDWSHPPAGAYAHPAHAKLPFGTRDLAHARWFSVDPALAWGFHASRLRTYRITRAHEAHHTLARWADGVRDGAFVVTSNVDGLFQRARFLPHRIVETQGAMEWLQCMTLCCEPFPGGTLDVEIDDETGFAVPALPMCPRCGSLARPNVALPEDKEWDPARAHEQEERLNLWLGELRGQRDRKLVVVECGVAPEDVGMRARGERMVAAMGGTLVRIDERDAHVKAPNVGIEMPPGEAIAAIDVGIARLTRR
jgi:NAD-dependent SIR2 family protein deacetylase